MQAVILQTQSWDPKGVAAALGTQGDIAVTPLCCVPSSLQRFRDKMEKLLFLGLLLEPY